MTGGIDTGMVERARGWIGTPYRHQTSLKGVGTDCLGLVRGLWRETYGAEAETPEPYAPDWAEVGGEERLLAAARRRLVERPPAEARPGDVLVFRMSAEVPAKHCGVLSQGRVGGRSGEARMIHAYWGRGVVESWLGDWWRRRLVAAFGWPDLSTAGVEATTWRR